jgi:hypothetical protein
VRDRGSDPSGKFDAIQATGSLAAATAQAAQLSIISPADAREIVERIGQALLMEMPRDHGLLPHFVQVSPTGVITTAMGVEYSSVDTVIAAIGLLTAQQALNLDTSGAEALLTGIDWEDLVKPDGISMGYACGETGVCPLWDVFGAESCLVALAYAAATGNVAPIAQPTPPTANGSGFIDELAWLFVPPPDSPDTWGTDWTAYRSEAVDKQIGYYRENDPASCFALLGLFGLSAGEMPDESYRTLGVGGRDPQPHTGAEWLGAPVVTPHYAGMIASLRPEAVIWMWDWLIANGLFTPLNNVESLMFPPGAPCDQTGVVWNHGKLSWNLALQTLGWGRHLAEHQGNVPVLWQAAMENSMVQEGYRLLAPNGPASILAD